MIDPDAPVSARILDESRSIRRLAVAALVPDRAAAIFALRSVLVRDEDAGVRALAAARLRALDPRGFVRRAPALAGAEDPPWAAPQDEAEATRCREAVEDALADALLDPSAIVREEAARTAGALRAERAEAALSSAVRADGSWRARRAAVRAIGRIGGERAAFVLFEALDDPFWRVRYAAIQALAARPEAQAKRDARSAREAAARAYLEAVRLGERSADADARDPSLVHADEEEAHEVLGDPDPAVVAARIATAPPGPEGGARLVLAIASSHASLRRAAIRILAARHVIEELFAALVWLDDPRVLYAGEAVRRLLRRVRTVDLVERVIRDPSSGPGARAWALAEAARLRIGVPREALEAAFHAHEIAVRRAAIWVAAERGDVGALIAKLTDPEDTVRAEAVDMLGAALDDPAVRAALPGPEDSVFVARALLGAVRLAIGRALDPRASAWIDVLLFRATNAPWADVRAEAISLRARRRSIPEEERRARLVDPDPWVREAAVDATAGARMLASDPDPFVRRAAARASLVPSGDRQGGEDHLENKAVPSDPPSSSRLRRAAVSAARSPDPWIRAVAACAIDGAEDEGLALLLRLTRDRSPMVRAAAADAIDRSEDVEARCLAIVRSAEIEGEVRLAAHARLLASPSAASLGALAADLQGSALSKDEREVLHATALAYPDDVRARVPELPAEPARVEPAARARVIAAPRKPPRVAHRTLGNTGIAIAPLGISGAGEMPIACYEAARDAGANLFFWEPTHRSLSVFLKRAPDRRDLVIVTGSYEADARSIERDVDRALRRLRVDALGVMLLFWVRSSARLGDVAWHTLERLKNKGKVRAIGFSTHLRDLAAQAIAARPWDVVMCRLSAAHPGAERQLLPAAVAQGTGVIAFSALCYGRLVSAPLAARTAARRASRELERAGVDVRAIGSSGAVALDPTAPDRSSLAPMISAADCYRYALSQPGVSACLSSPRRFRELSENLAVLRDPTLDRASIERLRAHGERVREENRTFASLVHRA